MNLPTRRTTRLALPLIGVAAVAAALLLARVGPGADALTATARVGSISPRLTLTGSLRPAESITYRSPLEGREAEITFLVDEGTRVQEGDLLVRLDATGLERDLERALQDMRQVDVDLRGAEIDREESLAVIRSLSDGEGAIMLEEARTRRDLAGTRAERLREAHRTLEPLLARGFITREELQRTRDELDRAEEDLVLARRRLEVLVGETRPREQARAELQFAQRAAQLENVRAKRDDAAAAATRLREQLEASTLYARRPGLVIYEEYLSTSPRRKIRAGDRVTPSHGIVTISEVDGMLVDATVTEGDVHRVRAGQPVVIRLEAFPDLVLSGAVVSVGTLARALPDRPADEKRFDVIAKVDQSPAELRPEMTVRLEIALGDRDGVLMIPVNAVFERGGAPVVHVYGRFGVETRAVQLGTATDAEAEVIAGLDEGDRVMLTDAPGSSSAGPAASRSGAAAAGRKSGLLP